MNRGQKGPPLRSTVTPLNRFRQCSAFCLAGRGQALGLLLLLWAWAGCTPPAEERIDIEGIFEKAGYPGSVWIEEETTRMARGLNFARCDSAFLPASTFKIFNSLAALESGVAPDEHLVIPWDSVVRDIPAWNRDHDMASAIKVSCVPYYQEIARRIGRERMQAYLDRESYGNATIGPDIDKFWLDGSLRITQFQQIDFLKKLSHGQLHFSARNQAIVRRILLTDSTADYQIYSKTGWGVEGNRDYGWWVGWVEKPQGRCYFALNIWSDAPGDDFGEARISIVKEILRKTGWLPG